jgi:hypothetical protein
MKDYGKNKQSAEHKVKRIRLQKSIRQTRFIIIEWRIKLLRAHRMPDETSPGIPLKKSKSYLIDLAIRCIYRNISRLKERTDQWAQQYSNASLCEAPPLPHEADITRNSTDPNGDAIPQSNQEQVVASPLKSLPTCNLATPVDDAVAALVCLGLQEVLYPG